VLKKILIALLVLLVVAAFLLAREWDSPRLGRALLDQVGQATGLELEASGFRLSLLRGLVLEEVKGRSSEAGRELAFSLDRLVFEHRLLPLLRGTVAVDRVELLKPQIELVEKTGASRAGGKTPVPPPAPQPSPPPSGDVPLALEVREIRVADGTLALRVEGVEGETRVEGLEVLIEDLRLDPGAGLLAGLAAKGELGARRVLVAPYSATDLRGRYALAEGRLEMSSLEMMSPYGPFTATMQIDLNAVPYAYTLTAKGDPLDLNRAMGASEGFGPGRAEMKASGAGPESKAVKASGEVALAAGRFPAAPAFEGVDAALGKKVLVGSSYQATSLRFRLANDVVTLQPFRLEAELARLDLQGTVKVAGPLDLALSVATPREGVEIDGLGGSVLDLMSDAQGWVPVPMKVSGTIEKPRVLPDVKALSAQAGRGAKREAEAAAMDALGGLLGKKKKN
jgi:hypothetical protein